MPATPRFELYSYWRTSATYRVRVALNLKGLCAVEHNVNLDAGEQRSEAFLKINPLGAIPALIDLGAGQSHAPITQSLTILEYLEDVHPLPALLPAGPIGRARVRSIAQMLAADTHPLITGRIKKYLTTEGKFDDAAFRAWQIHWFT
ncbi:MAG: glutathione S-transferase N-terminal domain-containing protein, partial [Hyphomicrobium sp.]